MRRPIRGWFAVPKGERRAVVTLACLVPLVHLAVRVAGYPRVQQWLDRRASPPRGSARETPADSANALTLAATRVQRYSGLPGNCLSRGMALTWLLQRAGHPARLRHGVARPGGGFAAHAWVELEGGRVLTDTANVTDRYVALDAVIPRRR